MSVSLCVCVRERVMSYEIMESLAGCEVLGPFEGSSTVKMSAYDLEGLEQVYDIISVLPKQRYVTDSPDSLIYSQGLESYKQPQSVGTRLAPECSTLSRLLARSKRYTLDRQTGIPTSALRVETEGHWIRYLVLGGGLCYMSGVGLRRVWCQSKQTSEGCNQKQDNHRGLLHTAHTHQH